MFEVGRRVRVLEPFAADFPDEYEITEVDRHDDGQIVCTLGEHGGFDPKFLEVVA